MRPEAQVREQARHSEGAASGASSLSSRCTVKFLPLLDVSSRGLGNAQTLFFLFFIHEITDIGIYTAKYPRTRRACERYGEDRSPYERLVKTKREPTRDARDLPCQP